MATKDEIFNYVINTPENTNPAVLRDMLNSIGEGGGSGIVVAHGTVSEFPDETSHEPVAVTLDMSVEELKAAGINSAIEISYSETIDATTITRTFYLFPSANMEMYGGNELIVYTTGIIEGLMLTVSIGKNTETSEYEVNMYAASVMLRS